MDRLIVYLVGRALFICSGLMLIPFVLSIYLDEFSMTGVFGEATFITLLAAVYIRGHSHNISDSLSVFGGVAFLFACWLSLSIFGALPYYLSGSLSFLDSFVESVSGFTTTGYTNTPFMTSPSLILWRSLTQWMGGCMVFLFITTILPAISGCFGMSFAMPVALKTGIITLSRLKKNTRRLMKIYFIMTLTGFLIYYVIDMNAYDALNMAMVTISTGGCYMPDADFHISFMFGLASLVGLFSAGCNIIIYWQAIKRRQLVMLKNIAANTETRIFLLMIILAGLITSIDLYSKGYYDLVNSFVNGFFQVSSFASTTGTMHYEMLHWPELDKMILILLASVGGCIGSLAGGFKVLRLMILLKSCTNELQRTIHPDIVLHMDIDSQAVPDKLVNRLLGFFFMILITLIASILVISAAGLNMQQSMDIAIACLTSTGQIIFFHTSQQSINELPASIKLFCSFLMILGKVDIFAFLLLVYGGRQKLMNQRW